MTDVEIEFCVPSDLLGSAQSVQEDLITEFGEKLDGVRLKTGHGGVFKVRVGGELIFDGEESSYERDDVLEAVRQRI